LIELEEQVRCQETLRTVGVYDTVTRECNDVVLLKSNARMARTFDLLVRHEYIRGSRYRVGENER
jgi:hypothetical protein